MVGMYLRNTRSPALLGGTSQYRPARHPGLRGLGMLHALGDAGIPAGSTLSYTAQWGNNFTSWNDPNAIQSAVQTVLAQQYGIIVTAQFHTTSDLINFSGKSGFTLTLQTNRAYGAEGDIKSIVDGELYRAGVLGVISTIAVTQQVSAPAATITLAQAQANLAQAQASGDTAAAAQWTALITQLSTGAMPGSVSTWLSDNWPWLAAAGIGLIVVREVL